MNVVILRIKGNSVLVEYTDKSDIRRRVSVSEDLVVERPDGTSYVDDSELEVGIPYGIPWADFLYEFSLVVTGEMVAKSLVDVGVWTKEDFKSKPDSVIKAVQSIIMPSVLNALHKIVSKVEKQEEFTHE